MKRALAAALIVAASPACAGPPVADRPVRVVEITIRHSRFQPARFDAQTGETVRFVVRNIDPIDHELIVGDAAVQDRHEWGTEARHAGVPGEVSVAPGLTVTTSYTFAGPGVVLMGCHLPGHYAYGMRGRIRVV
ncbi:MAG: cupredoxin domain-containing protein [Actinomycetota bacterium]